MKRKWIITLLVVGSVAYCAWLAPAIHGADLSTSELMKAKLAHAQEILRGIALEDYNLIQSNAQKLSRLSQGSGWYTRQTPEYEMFTVELRRHADALAKAARNRNLDAASLAYFQLTVSCVSCHKYLRGSKEANLGSVPGAGSGN